MSIIDSVKMAQERMDEFNKEYFKTIAVCGLPVVGNPALRDNEVIIMCGSNAMRVISEHKERLKFENPEPPKD